MFIPTRIAYSLLVPSHPDEGVLHVDGELTEGLHRCLHGQESGMELVRGSLGGLLAQDLLSFRAQGTLK